MVYQIGNTYLYPSRTYKSSSTKPWEIGKRKHKNIGTGFGTETGSDVSQRRQWYHSINEDHRQRKLVGRGVYQMG